MNIAMFTDSYTPYVSGVVRSIQRFSRGLTTLGHKVYIFAPDYHRDMAGVPDTDATHIYRFHSVPAPTCPSFFLPIPISVRADRLMRKLEINIIHTHSPFLMGQLGAILARKRDIPLLFTHHTLYHEYTHYVPVPQGFTRQMIINYLHRYFRHCDHVITPTPQIKDLLLDLYNLPNPITPIPTGIDLSHYRGANQDWLRQQFSIEQTSKIVLFIGRLGKEKNPIIVLEAFSLLAKQNPSIHMVFVGEGPEKEHLVQWSNEHKLKQKVHFTGSIEAQKVADCCCGADLFMFGSTTETQGLVLGEAMAAGLPVVAVEATGTNDIVIHGYNGYITESEPHALAEYSHRILNNPTLYASMRVHALRTAQQLSIDTTASQLLAVYEQALTTRFSSAR